MKHFLIFVVALWSSFSAQAKPDLNSCFGGVDKTYTASQDETKILNMPRVESQDSLGICYAFAAATVSQQYMCQKNKTDCTNLSGEQKISPLAMTAWRNSDNGSNLNHDSGNHMSLHLDAGDAFNTMNNCSHDFSFYSDSCYPFDQFANKYGKDPVAVQATLSRLKKTFQNANHLEGSICTECLIKEAQQELSDDLGLKAQADDLKKYFGSETFNKFLYRSIFDKCDKYIDPELHPKVGTFPEKGKQTNYTESINKIKEILKTGSPMALGGICQHQHVLVVDGYRKMCKPSGECRDVLRVQNSWGEQWQKDNNDGWIDAQKLLHESDYKENMLTWYHD